MWPMTKRAPVTRKRVESLERALIELEERHESLHASHKRLNSRVAMREARAKLPEKNGDGDPEAVARLPGESDLEWKNRVRGLIRMGKLRSV